MRRSLPSSKPTRCFGCMATPYRLTTAGRFRNFLFLCECEETLLRMVPVLARKPFSFVKRGTYFKGHGKDAATALRAHLGRHTNQVGMDVFGDIRAIGLHVFRRQLHNFSDIWFVHPPSHRRSFAFW